MKKYIYGLIDVRTNTLGDLCLLDRDEVFRDGLVDLLSDPAVPDYLVNDLSGFCFGSVSLNDDSDPVPSFHIFPVPKLIISGGCVEIQSMRKEASVHADVSENS